jgi:hypothetical protein
MTSDIRHDLTPEQEALLRQHLAHPPGEPSIADLIGGLIGDAQRLLRREVNLARREVTIEIDKAKQGIAIVGVGAGLTVIGGLLLSQMLVYVLHDLIGLALWVSYLIVGALLTGIGAIALRQGATRIGTIDPVPHAALNSVRKDVEWISEQNPSSKT